MEMPISDGICPQSLVEMGSLWKENRRNLPMGEGVFPASPRFCNPTARSSAGLTLPQGGDKLLSERTISSVG